MARFKSPFQAIDEAIFKGVDNLKASTAYNNITDVVHTMPENQQKVLNQLANLFLLLSPFLIVGYFFILNTNLKNEIEIKNELKTYIEGYSSKKATLNVTGRNVFSPSPILNEADFNAKLRRSLSARRIPANQVLVKDFVQTSAGATIKKITAKLSYNKLNMSQFSAFLTTIQLNERMKITKSTVKKDKEQNLLFGEIHILQISRLK